MKRFFVFFAFVILFLQGCTIHYGMLDGSITAESFSVELFEEQASNAPAGYGATYTDFLKDFVISRTKMKLKNTDADIEISGKIVKYGTTPLSVQSDEQAALNRLSVTIAVTAINNKEESQSFESNFSQFSDYSAEQDLATIETQLLDDINKKISQDIINKLSGNW